MSCMGQSSFPNSWYVFVYKTVGEPNMQRSIISKTPAHQDTLTSISFASGCVDATQQSHLTSGRPVRAGCVMRRVRCSLQYENY